MYEAVLIIPRVIFDAEKPRIFASSLRWEQKYYETWGFSGNVGLNILSSSLGNARTTFRICNIVFNNINLEICYSLIFRPVCSLIPICVS